MPRRFRIGRLSKNYARKKSGKQVLCGHKEQKESSSNDYADQSRSSMESNMDTSSWSSSVTSQIDAENNQIINDSSTSSTSGGEVHSMSSDYDTEALPESEQSLSSSISPTDNESSMVSDSSKVSTDIHSNDQNEGILSNTSSSLEALTSSLQLPSQQWIIQRQPDSTAICKISI